MFLRGLETLCGPSWAHYLQVRLCGKDRHVREIHLQLVHGFGWNKRVVAPLGAILPGFNSLHELNHIAPSDRRILLTGLPERVCDAAKTVARILVDALD